MSRLEVFKKFYVRLTEVPINDMIGELYANNLLPGDHKPKVESLSTQKEKAQHFLDEVIKPSLKIGYTIQFDIFIRIMESSDNGTLKHLAKEIRKCLPGLSTAILDSNSDKGKHTQYDYHEYTEIRAN